MLGKGEGQADIQELLTLKVLLIFWTKFRGVIPPPPDTCTASQFPTALTNIVTKSVCNAGKLAFPAFLSKVKD